MNLGKPVFYLSIVCSLSLFAEEFSEENFLVEALSRKDSLPKDTENANDTYLEGYIQALLNSNYYEFNLLVQVENGTVYLYRLPNNVMIKRSIIAYVKDVPGVKDVVEKKGDPNQTADIKREQQEVKHITGVWFPQNTLLFQPMIANPRETLYSVEYRWGDKVLGDQTVAVSYGDYFPIYRWRNVGTFGGDLELDIQAGVWSVFKMNVKGHGDEFSELINTDYLIGIPIAYAFDNWSFRFRGYHISGHLGDEYMWWNPGVVRKNPSMEAIDFFVQYQVLPSLRLYVGPGWVFHSDDSYYLKPFYVEWGGELRVFGTRFLSHSLYGTPFLAVNMRNWQACNWRTDFTGEIGYEWSKLQGIGRKLRIFGMYHNGYSEGQFFKETSSYGGVGLSWGF